MLDFSIDIVSYSFLFNVSDRFILNFDVLNFRVLASLNLPAALEESTGELLPQSLKDKARSVREVGGITLLNNLIAEFPSLLQRNKEILDEAERLLSEERNSDEQLKTQFKERWNRTPSTKLTEAFVTNISKYRSHSFYNSYLQFKI